METEYELYNIRSAGFGMEIAAIVDLQQHPECGTLSGMVR